MKISDVNGVYTYREGSLTGEIQVDSDWLEYVEEWVEADGIRLTTSGSTGEPKEVLLSKELITWSANNTKRVLGLKNEKVLSCLPLSKIGGRMVLLRALLFDWDIHVLPASSDPMLSLSKNHDFTLTSLVPYQVAKILKNPVSTSKLARFHSVLIGGGKMSKIVENQLFELSKSANVKFYLSYGMTETASHIALRRIESNGDESFELFPGIEPTLGDNNCLNIHIPELGLNLETNDQMRLDGNRLYYLGRVDDVVNSGGLKLQLSDITQKVQTLLSERNWEVDFFLWKTPDDELGEKLVFVGIHHDMETSIQDALSTHLHGPEVPKVFLWTKAFLRTESGKIDRNRTVSDLIEV